MDAFGAICFPLSHPAKSGNELDHPGVQSHFHILALPLLGHCDIDPLLTICGLEELDYHSARGVTHEVFVRLIMLRPKAWPNITRERYADGTIAV
jgi:hypothetical protein